LPGIKLAEMKNCLPDYVVESMREAILELDKKLKGFALPYAVMTGVETRSSAPIRIERENETMESANVAGLYPIGEGGGYAGGIISATVDGIKQQRRSSANISRLIPYNARAICMFSLKWRNYKTPACIMHVGVQASIQSSTC
jgi:uncharacterized FAD-dependent dehydrogenase